MSNRASSPPVVWASNGCCGSVRRAGVGAASYWETERDGKKQNTTCSERAVCSPAEWGHFSTPMRLPLMSAALSVSPIELQLHLFKRNVKEEEKFFPGASPACNTSRLSASLKVPAAVAWPCVLPTEVMHDGPFGPKGWTEEETEVQLCFDLS